MVNEDLRIKKSGRKTAFLLIIVECELFNQSHLFGDSIAIHIQSINVSSA